MPRRVVIAEPVLAPLEPLGHAFEILDAPDLWSRRRALLEAVGGADALVVRNLTRVDRDLLAAAPGLCVVGRLGSGLDNLDLAAIEERGIGLIDGRGLNAQAVAEYVLGAVVTVARRLVDSDRDIREGRWNPYSGQELAGETFGIVGGGATGAAVGRLAAAIGMEVICSDPHRPPPADSLAVSLEDLLRRSLVVSLHVPLNDSTRGLIGPSQLGLMRSDAILVNVARGGVLDEEALAAALSEGRLRGAVLDVRPVEPPPRHDPLAGVPGVLLTAHLAGHTERAQAAIARQVLGGVRAALERPAKQGRDRGGSRA